MFGGAFVCRGRAATTHTDRKTKSSAALRTASLRSRRRSGGSEDRPQPQLNRPATGRVRDNAEVRRTEGESGQPEVRMVEGVEQLHAKLQKTRGPEGDVLGER